MRRVLVLAVVLAAGTLAVPSPPAALACSFTGPEPTEAEYLAGADVVFEGVAGPRRNPNPGSPLPEPVFYTFTVDRVIKGGAAPVQEVTTAANGAACGIVFQEGARYRVYAGYEDGRLRTGLGSGTRLASAVPSTTVPRPAQPAPPTPSRRIALTG